MFKYLCVLSRGDCKKEFGVRLMLESHHCSNPLKLLRLPNPERRITWQKSTSICPSWIQCWGKLEQQVTEFCPRLPRLQNSNHNLLLNQNHLFCWHECVNEPISTQKVMHPNNRLQSSDVPKLAQSFAIITNYSLTSDAITSSSKKNILNYSLDRMSMPLQVSTEASLKCYTMA